MHQGVKHKAIKSEQALIHTLASRTTALYIQDSTVEERVSQESERVKIAARVSFNRTCTIFRGRLQMNFLMKWNARIKWLCKRE